MEKKKGHRITAVDPGSIAEELEIEPEDRLLFIDGQEIEDIFDYRFYTGDTYQARRRRMAFGD